MESPSWKATSRSATPEFPNILRNPKAHYRVHKKLSLVPILSYMDRVHPTPSILIVFYHLHIGLHSNLFPSDFSIHM
jgi:hypothetical protein